MVGTRVSKRTKGKFFEKNQAERYNENSEHPKPIYLQGIHNYSQNFLKIAMNSLVGVLYRARRKRADGLLPNILSPAFEIG